MGDKEDNATNNVEKFQLRLPTGMRDRLKVEAAASGRSLNSEILVRLDMTLGGDSDIQNHGVLPAGPERVAELVVKALKPVYRKLQNAPPEKINLDRINVLFGMVSSINESRTAKLPAARLMYFATLGYNELLSLVSNPDDEKEVHAFLPAVRYRIEQAMDRNS